MTDLQEAGELATGELVDNRYRLQERIGEGGMARVYRAEDVALRRTVALKVLRGPLDGSGAIERALSETTLLAALNHHSLVTLFDARIAEDEPSYLVMEYVDGITLRERIAHGPVDPKEIASIAVDIAEGLHVAHSDGIVHRDIKPSNILLWRSPLPGREWRAKVADFGIAYLLDSPRVTVPGLAMGTAGYIAPEQARGEPPAPPADIYAFGIMLIEALTGARPFSHAEGIGTVMARLAAPPPVPDTLDPAWQGLLRGMTAMRPDDRPTALDVAVTAARLANGDAARPAARDESTDPVSSETGATAVLPVAGVLPFAGALGGTAGVDDETVAFAASASAGDSAAGAARSTGRAETSVERPDRRRRRAAVGAALAAVALILAITAAVWSTSLAGNPGPNPAPSTVVEPSDEPSIAPTEESPAPVDDDKDDDDRGRGNDDDGGGSDNSGPGNNNGNGGGNGNGNGDD